jgi:general L-amino acid transport system substrate-binding protein
VPIETNAEAQQQYLAGACDVYTTDISGLAATRATFENPEIERLLGTSGELGAMLGLSNDWAVNVIEAVGNYGEVFEGNIGENTPVGLARGLNAQWTEGGLLYAPPFR